MNTPDGTKIILLRLLLVLLVCSMMSISTSDAADAPKTMMKTDEKRLAGQWVRPDGGYTLELKEIKKDGSLKASYFNPNPIRVFSARWSRKDGLFNVFVELRDLNYPGSKYDLQYDSWSDSLRGTYFQAVEKQTYAVEFIRAK